MGFFKRKAGKSKGRRESVPAEELGKRGEKVPPEPAAEKQVKDRDDGRPALRKRSKSGAFDPGTKGAGSRGMATLGLQRLKAKTAPKGKPLGRAARGEKPFTPLPKERADRLRVGRGEPEKLVDLSKVTTPISPREDVRFPGSDGSDAATSQSPPPLPKLGRQQHGLSDAATSQSPPPPPAAPPPLDVELPVSDSLPSAGLEKEPEVAEPPMGVLEDGAPKLSVDEFSVSHEQAEATFTYHQRSIDLSSVDAAEGPEMKLVIERLDGSPEEGPSSSEKSVEAIEPEAASDAGEESVGVPDIEAVIERFDKIAEEKRLASEKGVEEFVERIGGLKQGAELRLEKARSLRDEGIADRGVIERFGEPKFREPRKREEEKPAKPKPRTSPKPAGLETEPVQPDLERVDITTGPPETPGARPPATEPQAVEFGTPESESSIPAAGEEPRGVADVDLKQQEGGAFELLEPSQIFGASETAPPAEQPSQAGEKLVVELEQSVLESPSELFESSEAARQQAVEIAERKEEKPAVEKKGEGKAEVDLVGAFSEAFDKLMSETAAEEVAVEGQEAEGFVEYQPEEVEDLNQMFLQMLSNYLKPLEEGFDTLEKGQYDDESIAGLLGAVRPLMSAALQMGFDEIAERLKEIESPLQMYRRGKLTKLRQAQMVNMTLSYRQLLKILPKPKKVVAEHRRFTVASELIALLKTVPEVTTEYVERLFACGISTLDIVRRTPPYEISITTGIPEKIAYSIYTEVVKSMEKEV